MKCSLVFNHESVANAALEDAKNLSLDAVLEKKEDKFELVFESKADGYGDKEEKPAPTWDDVRAIYSSCMAELNYQIKWLKEDMKYATEAFYKHMEGHLPAIKDVGKMKAAIKALGMEDSYEVEKKRVYVEW